ncbi:diguanylate cyclase domain-containing protein [Vibrio atypicus]|uniref:diguanylate cyclase domain-containing protein n=1 Tax=Vibrio atypicus TaxID=558271 RepID=UPI00373627AC
MNTFTQYSDANNKALELLTGLQGDRNIADVEQAIQALDGISETYREQLSPLFYEFLESTLSYRQGHLSQALECYEHLLSQFRRPEEYTLFPYVCVYIGTIYMQRGQYQLSQHYYCLAEKNLERPDNKLLAFLNVNLSGTYLQQKEWQQALICSLRALEYNEDVCHEGAHSMGLLNSALAYTKLGEFEKAKEQLDLCVDFSEQKNLLHASAYTQLYLAVWFDARHDEQSAQQAFKQAFRLTKEHGDSLLQIEFFEAYVTFLFNVGNYTQILVFIEKILPSPALKQSLPAKLALCRMALKSAEKLGDVSTELSYLRRIDKLQQQESEFYMQQEREQIKSSPHSAKYINDYQHSLVIQDRLSVLSELGQMLNGGKIEQQEFLRIFPSLKTLLPVSSFGLAFYDPEVNELDYQVMIEEGIFHPPFKVSCDSVSKIGIYCAKHRQTLRLNTGSNEELKQYLDPEFHSEGVWSSTDGEKDQHGISVIYVPVVYQDELLAVMSVQFNRCNEYTTAHEKITEQLASYLAVAISHNRQRVELANHSQYLEQIYHTDHLTGLKNRFGFVDWLTHSIRSSCYPNGAFLISMDGLKSFNRRHSRQSGDDALAETAHLVQEHLISNQQVFRYQSDTFLVIGQFDDKNQVKKVATSMQAMLKEYFGVTYADEKSLSSTVGVIWLDEAMQRSGYESKIADLEATLYEVKKNKSDGVFFLKNNEY